jgi:hypothetical protein
MSQLPISHAAPDVVGFRTAFGLSDAPICLCYHNAGYATEWCHVSAKHHAMKNGGKRVHGWALWQFPNGVMGDFHSVWESPDKTLIDVTPPKYGKNRVLFVRDRVTDIYLNQSVFVLPTNRMSPPNSMYWWDGKPTAETIWGLQQQNKHFVKYCNTLNFPVNELETTLPFG